MAEALRFMYGMPMRVSYWALFGFKKNTQEDYFSTIFFRHYDEKNRRNHQKVKGKAIPKLFAYKQQDMIDANDIRSAYLKK